MKALALEQLGQNPSFRDLPVPEPARDEVLIRVAAVGMNPFDAFVVAGNAQAYMEYRFPLVPGADASGTIAAVGEGVDEWAVGDEVFGSGGKMYVGEGTLADFATLSTASIARRPPAIDHRTAAAIPIAGTNALLSVEALDISPGDVVVAIGATGGVGTFLTQLATRRGAHVVAVCSTANLDYARSLGAAEVIDYTTQDVVEAVRAAHPDGIDGIADMHGDRTELGLLAEQLRSGGRATSSVMAADVEALAARGIKAANIIAWVSTATLDLLAGMLVRGEILLPAIRAFPMTQATDALDLVGTHHVRGKVVVLPD
jgi:NADPH:quinone reductase-like Zn-dependent oxidoreductase